MTRIDRIQKQQMQHSLLASYARQTVRVCAVDNLAAAAFRRDMAIRELARLEHDEARLTGGEVIA